MALGKCNSLLKDTHETGKLEGLDMSLEEIATSVGKEWLIVLGLLFLGVLYWAFRPGRPRADRHHHNGGPPPAV